MVLPDGTLKTVSSTEEPDLFWAIRGGGNQFGIVYNWRLKTNAQSSQVYGGLRTYTADQIPAVLKAVAEYVSRNIPPGLKTLLTDLNNVPHLLASLNTIRTLKHRPSLPSTLLPAFQVSLSCISTTARTQGLRQSISKNQQRPLKLLRMTGKHARSETWFALHHPTRPAARAACSTQSASRSLACRSCSRLLTSLHTGAHARCGPVYSSPTTSSRSSKTGRTTQTARVRLALGRTTRALSRSISTLHGPALWTTASTVTLRWSPLASSVTLREPKARTLRGCTSTPTTPSLAHRLHKSMVPRAHCASLPSKRCTTPPT